jgi:hypothetical protein
MTAPASATGTAGAHHRSQPVTSSGPFRREIAGSVRLTIVLIAASAGKIFRDDAAGNPATAGHKGRSSGQVGG